MDYPHTCTNEDCQGDYEITITHFRPSIEGRYSGPPEYCYPGEAAEIEWDETPCPHCGKVEDSDTLYDKMAEWCEDGAQDDGPEYEPPDDYDDPRNDYIM